MKRRSDEATERDGNGSDEDFRVPLLGAQCGTPDTADTAVAPEPRWKRRSSSLGRRAVVAALSLLWLAATAVAGDVQFELTATETYVGMPVILTVVVKNASEHEQPPLPQIADARVLELLPPSTQSSTFVVNGRMTSRKSVTYRFQILPQKEGIVTIPAFGVRADGRDFEFEGAEILVSKSESGDLMFVEIVTPRKSVYLGQPVDLTLRIWIKPFTDKRLRVRLDEGQMWSLVDDELSTWGPFLARLQELARARRRPSGREVQRNDSQGQRHAYFLYELKHKFWPEQAGPLSFDEVAVAMAYPERLRRERRIFSFSDLQVSEARPVRVAVNAPAFTVLSPPAEGRPRWFTGAVGRFGLTVKAAPRDAAVGEPITLTIEVQDRTPGGSRLELLPPPPLGRVDELTQRFRIPADPLAGVVSGRTKRFTQTIRPLDDQVKQIPAIPLSFFDPLRQSYQTVWSKPIDVAIRSATTMSMTDVVGGEVADERPTELTEVSGGLLANYVEPGRVLRSQRVEAGWWLALVLGVPPLLTLGTLIVQRRQRRMRDDLGYTRQRRARKQALGRLAGAAGLPAGEQTELVGSAVGGYVADRCNLPAGAATCSELAEALRRRGAAESISEELERLLNRCEAARYAGLDAVESDDLTRKARDLIDRLERERLC